jgi:hydroxyethylthiazole kinase-like uncharacterized protein yjeF
MSHQFIKELKASDNKYSHGTVCVVAGSKAYSGAAVLAVGGARRGGSGYINYLHLEKLPTFLVLRAYPDVVARKTIANIHVDAWVIGPGSPKIPRNFQIPKAAYAVLDAAAISLTSEINAQWKVITPHAGEAKRLGYNVDEDQTDRRAVALVMAKELGAVVVLKGAHTVIATPSGNSLVDHEGGPELATAGTGDVLAGLIGSMLASWKPQSDEAVLDVVARAVTMHSRAGQKAARKINPITATDLLEFLGKVDR